MKVGRIRLETEQNQIIEEVVECNENEYFKASKHPARRIKDRINDLMQSQLTLGDPIVAIKSDRFCDATGEE